ncbi:MAG: hypothetical protein RLZZ324_920 [Candidatus Parcubacteria bacterium]|jgi:type IV pilus assembly protein PilM
MAKHVFGLDISDRSVELAVVAQKKGALRVLTAVRAELPAGTVELGVIQEKDTLARILSHLVDAAFGPRHGSLAAGVSLPEMVTYSKMFTFPATLTPELAEKAVALEASNVFPLAVAHSVTAYQVLARGKESQDIFFVAADKDAARDYLEVLRRVGIQPLFLEVESRATGLALIDPRIEEPVLVADIGARTTTIAVHERGTLRMSGTIMMGSDALTATVEQRLGISLPEAEELRRKAGFDPAIDDGRLFLIMEKPMNEIINEMHRTIAFYEAKTGRKVSKALLAGGAALTPQIHEFIDSNFPEVKLLRDTPLTSLVADALPNPAEFKRSGILWATAIGLALRASGVRGSPGVNLMPGSKSGGGGGGRGLFGGFNDALTALSDMVKGKKSGGTKKGKEAAQVRPQDAVRAPALETKPAAPPVRLQIDAAPAGGPIAAPAPVAAAAPVAPTAPVAATAPVAPPAPAPAPAPVAAKPAPESPKPAKTNENAIQNISDTSVEPPQPATPSEPDFGRGIGDILSDDGKLNPVKLTPMPEKPIVITGAAQSESQQSEKRSIASILESDYAPAQASEAPRADYGLSSQRRGGKAGVIAMVVLTVLLFSAAAGGVYMFVVKYGVPTAISGMFGAKKAAPAAPAGGTTVPAQPASVSVALKLSTKALTGETRPVVLTRIVETDVQASDSFAATGVGAAADSKATGEITVTNTSSAPFTFVATTRFLSKEGVLFRLVSQASIPANGSVKVQVAADKPGPEGNIGPSTFTVPGLPPAKQKLVTGASTAPMKGTAGTGKGTSDDDLALAKKALTDKLKKDAMANFKALLTEGEMLSDDLVTAQDLSVDAPKTGTAGDKFTMKLSLRFRAMVIPEKDVLPLLTGAVPGALPSGAAAADYTLGTPFYTVDQYSPDIEQAEVRAEAPLIKR